MAQTVCLFAERVFPREEQAPVLTQAFLPCSGRHLCTPPVLRSAIQSTTLPVPSLCRAPSTTLSQHTEAVSGVGERATPRTQTRLAWQALSAVLEGNESCSVQARREHAGGTCCARPSETPLRPEQALTRPRTPLHGRTVAPDEVGLEFGQPRGG